MAKNNFRKFLHTLSIVFMALVSVAWMITGSAWFRSAFGAGTYILWGLSLLAASFIFEFIFCITHWKPQYPRLNMKNAVMESLAFCLLVLVGCLLGFLAHFLIHQSIGDNLVFLVFVIGIIFLMAVGNYGNY